MTRTEVRVGPPGRSELSESAGQTVVEVLERLDTGAEGLASDEARARLLRDGPNRMPGRAGPGLVRQFTGQLVHFFALMLWAGSVLAFVGGLPQLGWAIIFVVVINGAFSFVQEYRAERATKELAALLPERTTVVRSGKKIEVPAEELVRGDVVPLREGDRISADCRMVLSHGLKVDNSALTGESEPVERLVDPEPEPPLDALEARCVIFAGTYVTSGSGVAVVVATGGDTRLGAISQLTGEIVRRPSPLRIQLDRMVRVVGIVAVGTGGVFFAVSLAMGEARDDAFLFAVGVIVALIPEGLLPTFTLSLAMGATRMAHRGALVRHLDAVETLGCTTVICTDKTGTITTNQMTARRIAVLNETFTVSGSGYQPSGTIFSGDRPLSDEELVRIRPLLHAAALCGDAHVDVTDGRAACHGDPVDGALLVLARKGGLQRENEERRAPRLLEFPFESVRQRMTTIHVLPTGAFEVITKGAPEVIVPLCKAVRRGSELLPLGDDEELSIRAAVDQMAMKGLRVLAFARKEAEGTPPSVPAEAERDLEFLGLVGMADPIRPEVPDAIARCKRAGIRVIMITGDHPATAMRVAREVGLPAESVVIGSELPDDRRALSNLLGTRLSVLARIPPEQKLAIAQALQDRGDVVAMTGDGVNDAPALRRADIGVAMGSSGTDVAREAADLVLLDDNFAHIVEAVEEGRAAFANMRRFLTYVLTSNVPELVPFLAWALSGGSIPLALTVMQILAIDLVTDLLPALGLGAEAPSPNLMKEAPRPPRERLLDRRLLLRSYGFLGPIEAVGSMLMIPIGAALFFGWTIGETLPQDGVALATLSAMLWATIVTMQVANGFECRSATRSLFRVGFLSNRLFVATVGFEIAMMLLLIYVAPIADLLGQHPLSVGQWVPVVLAPWLLIGLEEARKAVVRSRYAAAERLGS